MALYHRPDHDLEPPNWKLTFDPALKADPALRYDTSLLLLPKTFDPSSSEHVGMRYYIDQEIPMDSSPGLLWKFHARTSRAKPNRLCALMYLGKVEEDEDMLREVVERVALPLDVPDEVREASKTRSRGWALDVIMVSSISKTIMDKHTDGTIPPNYVEVLEPSPGHRFAATERGRPRRSDAHLGVSGQTRIR